MKVTRIVLAVVAVVTTGLLATSCSTTTSAPRSSGNETRQLIGLFRVRPGIDTGGQLSGSWFRMLKPGGSIAGGPYMKNANSSADDGYATLLAPGTAGGLRTGSYQPQPTPGFDAGGNALANSILTPTEFSGHTFSVSTNRTDPQTKTVVPPPTVVVHDGVLTANFSSWSASWNKQDFNQGAPKPGASGGASATGAIDVRTGHFYLQWTSVVVGGPFNGFTGIWRLQGVYQPSGRAPAGA